MLSKSSLPSSTSCGLKEKFSCVEDFTKNGLNFGEFFNEVWDEMIESCFDGNTIDLANLVFFCFFGDLAKVFDLKKVFLFEFGAKVLTLFLFVFRFLKFEAD